MASNEEVLQKISTGDLTDGAIIDENFDQFFEDVQGQTDVLDRTRALSVTADSGDIPRLDIAPQTMTAVAEGEKAPLSNIDQPSVHYQTQKVSIATQLTYEAANETIDNLPNAIRQMMAEGFAQDLERVASIGDESASGFAAINDGWITLAESKGSPTYDHADGGGSPQPVNKTLFGEMVSTLPERYAEANPRPVFLMSREQKFAYKRSLTDRNTGAADQMLMTETDPTGYGFDILTPLMWPNDQAMLTSPRNLVYVVKDRMRLEQTQDGKEVTLKDLAVVMNMLAEVDYQLMEPNGVVLGNNIAAP
jgi:hypothetical protein